MAKIAFVLSGCGVFDGSEIHEAVLCLLALAQEEHSTHFFAPDKDQAKVINHFTNEEVEETRNVLVESARIARGEISSLSELKTEEFDALLFPGGFGAAINLSTFASMGTDCEVDSEVERVVKEFHAAKKPIGATCIAPAFLAKIFEREESLTLTLGSDPQYAEKLESLGHQGVLAETADVVADEVNRIYTTPCYMNPPDLVGMFEGIQKLVALLGRK